MCENNKNKFLRLDKSLGEKIFVELPCVPGQVLYELFPWHKPPFIKQVKVEKVIFTETTIRLKLDRNSCYETSIKSLGKTLFIEEVDAQKALRKIEK